MLQAHGGGYVSLNGDETREPDWLRKKSDLDVIFNDAQIFSKNMQKRDDNDERIKKLKSKRNLIWTLFLLMASIGALSLSIESFRDDRIPMNFSYSLLLFAASICLLLTSLWKTLQMLTICTYSMQPLKINKCILSPGWSIAFIFLSICFALLCTFGLYTYPTEISYPFSVSLSLGICSFIFVIASTAGLYKYCGCCGMFVILYRKVSFYICVGFVIWDIISDILAATKVYIHHDYKFFQLSVAFSCITFLLYWIIGLAVALEFTCKNNDGTIREFLKDHDRIEHFKKYLLWTLYFPVLSMITITVYFPGSSLVALAFSSFPQYVISLSFILEHPKFIDTFNVMALIMSLFQLLSSPFLTTAIAVYKLEDRSQKKIEKMKAQHIATFGFVVFLAYMIFFLPILLLEIIHFCPILFEYYWYHNLSYDQLVIYLLCFNIPKFLFIGGTAVQKGIEEIKEIHNRETPLAKVYGSAQLIMIFIIYGLTFLVLPLIPVGVFCLGNVSSIFQRLRRVMGNDTDTYSIASLENEWIRKEVNLTRRNLFILFLYLLIAYGGMGRLLLGDNQIGGISFWMLMLTWILSAVIIILPLIAPLATFVFLRLNDMFEEEEKDNTKPDLEHVWGAALMKTYQILLCPCCFAPETLYFD